MRFKVGDIIKAYNAHTVYDTYAMRRMRIVGLVLFDAQDCYVIEFVDETVMKFARPIRIVDSICELTNDISDLLYSQK